MRRYLLSALCITLVAAGCTDSGSGSILAPESSTGHRSLAGIAGAGPRISWKSATTVFPTGIAAALVDGAMTYDGHHASIGAAVNVSGATSTALSLGPLERHTTSFSDNSHSASFRVPVASRCGHTANGIVSFAVWALDADGNVTERVTSQEHSSASQPPCDVGIEDRDEFVGRGGGGFGCPECVNTPADGVSWCKVRIHYYVDTGEVISATTLYCW